MYRRVSLSYGSSPCFPHRRGGVPRAFNPFHLVAPFSPQAWGCTVGRDCEDPDATVFPTGVGVYRRPLLPACTSPSFSPQAWGCTVRFADALRADQVFPTGVGVYRSSMSSIGVSRRFPHRRGGVPRGGVTGVLDPDDCRGKPVTLQGYVHCWRQAQTSHHCSRN